MNPASSEIGYGSEHKQRFMNDLMIAGEMEKVIFIIGGLAMSQARSDQYWANCFGDSAVDAVQKVKAVRADELPRFRTK